MHSINAGPAKGLKYPVELPTDKAIWAGTYESKLALSAVRAVSAASVCYDIGGYRGFFGAIFALAGAGLVVIYEPVPGNCAHIRKVLELNPSLPIRVENVAIGNYDGTTEFTVMADPSMGKIRSSPFQVQRKGIDSYAVGIRTIDSIVTSGEAPPPDLMKIDVEGAELDVLTGAMRTLEDKRPILFIEAHSPQLAADCASLLESLRYMVVDLRTGERYSQGDSSEITHLMASRIER